MRKKINPNLLRQKITQSWINNFYIQKPYTIENIFIKTFKIIYLIKIFLTTFRNINFFIKNKILKKKIKKINHNSIAVSNYKLLNILYEKKQNTFCFFCNVVLRNNFYTTTKVNTFVFKTLLFNLKKKITKRQRKQKKIKKLLNANVKKYGINTNLLKIFKNKNKNPKVKKLYRIIFKPLLKIKKINIKQSYLKKTKKKNNIYNKFYYQFLVKKQIYNIKKIKPKKHSSINLQIAKKKKLNFQKLTNFIYSQIYRTILENNLIGFFTKQKIAIKNLNIKIQLVQNYPIIQQNLDLMFKKILSKKPQLKKNLKALKKLFYLFPSFSIFYLGHLIIEQFSFELAKTKKHWKIIKTFELFLIQYLNANADFLNKNIQIAGIKIIITGRPNKSSRTKKIQLKFGLNKQTKIQTINLTKTFYTANAQIGNFGISFLLNL